MLYVSALTAAARNRGAASRATEARLARAVSLSLSLCCFVAGWFRSEEKAGRGHEPKVLVGVYLKPWPKTWETGIASGRRACLHDRISRYGATDMFRRILDRGTARCWKAPSRADFWEMCTK